MELIFSKVAVRVSLGCEQQCKRLSGRRNKVSGLAAKYQEAEQQISMFVNVNDWMVLRSGCNGIGSGDLWSLLTKLAA